MKKFLALVFVIAMIVTVVPTTFAAEAKAIERPTQNGQSPMSQKAVDSNGNVVEAANTHKEHKISMENVAKANTSVKADYVATKEGESSWQQVKRTALELMDPEKTLLEGYWLSKNDDIFGTVTDWYNDGRETVVQVLNVMEDGYADSGDAKAYKRFEQGEAVWFNYQVAKAFDTGSQMIKPLDKDVPVSAYLFGGTYEAFTSENSDTGIVMVDAWMSGQSKLSCKAVAPEDDYVFMFVFVINDTTIMSQDFGAWISISSAEAKNDFKAIKDGGKMTVGKATKTDIGGTDTSLVLAPYGTEYVMTNGAKYAVELDSSKNYVVMFESADSIGTRVYLCDENMDIINQTFVGSGAIAAGGNYKDSALAVLTAPVSGTYYVVVCGFYTGDNGVMETTVFNWNDVAAALPTSSTVIDLDKLGTTNHTEVDEATGVAFWGYTWNPGYSLGELIIRYPGTYTIKGNNSNVFCDIYDGVHIILDNATIGSTWKAGSGYAPSTIESKGDSTIECTSLQYAIYNYEGVNSGLYLIGDKLTVISGGSSEGAIITDSTPVHILTKTLEVYSTKVENIYPIALWVTGKNHPELTIGTGAKFDGENKKSKMFYDGDGNFFFGYTVSKYDELFRLRNEPTLNEASLEFVLSTEGGNPNPPTPGPGDDPQPPKPGEGMLGDANCDDKLNTGDATFILKHAAGIVTLEGQGLKNADVNQDSKVNTGDATMVLKIVAGIIPNPNK